MEDKVLKISKEAKPSDFCDHLDIFKVADVNVFFLVKSSYRHVIVRLFKEHVWVHSQYKMFNKHLLKKMHFASMHYLSA